MREPKIVDVEEYKPGYFRETRRKPKDKAQKSHEQRKAERQPKYYLTALDLVLIRSCVSVVAIGLVVRLGVMVYYILSCHRVEYDTKLSLFGIVCKFFWIWVDAKILKAWLEHVQSKLPPSQPGIARLIPLLARAAACFISGYAIHHVIVLQRLNFFFNVNKVMVMGGMITVGFIMFLRIFRLMSEILKEGDDIDSDAIHEFLKRHTIS